MTRMAAKVMNICDIAPYSPIAGMTGRGILGENLQLTYVLFDPGTEVPIHTHPQEQIGMLLRGEATLLVEGEQRQLTGLSGYVIPSGVEHGLRVGSEGAIFVEGFHPLRQDYVDFDCGVTGVPFQ